MRATSLTALCSHLTVTRRAQGFNLLPTSAPIATWRGLMNGAIATQAHCNEQGFQRIYQQSQFSSCERRRAHALRGAPLSGALSLSLTHSLLGQNWKSDAVVRCGTSAFLPHPQGHPTPLAQPLNGLEPERRRQQCGACTPRANVHACAQLSGWATS